MASVVVRRDSRDDIGIRGLELRLDGEFLANLAHGKSIEVNTAAGEHVLFATNSLYKQTITFKLAEDGAAQFEVANVVTGFGRVLMTIGGAIYRVRLRQIE